jgi:acetylornithine/succinyldiaminopimelate/putrescine aminotransferase
MLPEIRTSIPGPRSRDLARALRRHESQNVTYISREFPVFWDRAKGINVWDVDGNRLLDFTSAFGVCGLGHGHPAIRRAMNTQSEKLLHGMGDVHPTELKVQLCARLSALTTERWGLGAAKVLLANSGFEAVEAALKTAYLATNRPNILSFERGYHGHGYGALAAGSFPRFREPFADQLPRIGTTLPFARADSSPDEVASALSVFDEAIDRQQPGAVLIEPVQGRGGKNVAHTDFLRGLRDRCTASGTILIFDEILTGLNRTGRLFACEHFEVYPDIICLGKALTSGYPLSACIARAPVMDAWPESEGEALHTSTFLGNPVGCAMALASLEIHSRPETAQRVQEAGAHLRSRLEKIDAPTARRVAGLGLLLGLEVADATTAGTIVTRALADGLILLADSPEGNVISLVPSFDLQPEETAWACDRLQEYLTSFPGSVS